MYHQSLLRVFPTATALFAALIITSTTAAQTDKPLPIPDDTLPAELPLNEVPLGLSSDRPLPPGNELSAERVRLGRRLFFDPGLSSDGTVSCATCHLPDRAFTSSDPLAIGVGKAVGRRNTPTIVNRAYGKFFFWDGRSPSLEDQALQPIENPIEMANKLSAVIDSLRADASYREQFDAAYPGGVTTENLAVPLPVFNAWCCQGIRPRIVFKPVTSHHSATKPGRECGSLRVVVNAGVAILVQITPTKRFTTPGCHGARLLWIWAGSK